MVEQRVGVGKISWGNRERTGKNFWSGVPYSEVYDPRSRMSIFVKIASAEDLLRYFSAADDSYWKPSSRLI